MAHRRQPAASGHHESAGSNGHHIAIDGVKAFDHAQVTVKNSSDTNSSTYIEGGSGNTFNIGLPDSGPTKAADDNQRRDILAWLRKDYFDFGLVQRDHLEKRQGETGDWFLNCNEINDWLKSQGGTIWCYGIHGVGKSILASILIDFITSARKFLGPGNEGLKQDTVSCHSCKTTINGIFHQCSDCQDPVITVCSDCHRRRALCAVEGHQMAERFFHNGRIFDYSINSKHTQEPASIGYLYCDHKEAQRSADKLIATILYQLASAPYEVCSELIALYDEYTTEARSNTRPSLTEYTKTLQSQIVGYGKVFIIIDGLDEHNQHQRDEILNSIRGLQPLVNLFATSQEVPEIRRALKPTLEKIVWAQRTDMVSYINSKLDDKDYLFDPIFESKQGKGLRERVVNEVVETAREIFLVVELCMGLLLSAAGDQIPQKLTQILDDLKRLRSGTHKKLLSDIHDKNLHRLLNQRSSDAQLAKTILMWLCYAQVPLTAAALCHALSGQSEGTLFNESRVPAEDRIPNVCVGLVTIRKETKLVDFTNPSTKDFILNIQDKISFPMAGVDISWACLSYLTLQDFSDLESVHLPPITYRERQEGDRPWQERFPFYSYAARYWAFHARGLPEPDLHRLTHEFLDQDEDNRFCRAATSLLDQVSGSWNYGDQYQIPSFMSGIHLAVYFKLKTSLEALLTRKSTELKDSNGWTPLWWAAIIVQDLQIVHFLLRRSANPDSRDKLGQTMIIVSLQPAVVESELYSYYYNIKISGETTVHLGDNHLWTDDAIITFENCDNRGYVARPIGNFGITELLINLTKIINACDNNGQTALSIAARYRQWNFVAQLLRKGANKDLEDHSGMTPLLEALGGLLIQEKTLYANVKARGEQAKVQLGDRFYMGKRLVFDPSEGEKRKELAEAHILSLLGARIEATDANGNTALALAVEHRLLAVVSKLLQLGANIEANNNVGQTPLLLACLFPRNSRQVWVKNVSIKAATCLIGCEVKWNILSDHRAIKMKERAPRFDTIIRLLLKYGASIENAGGSQTLLEVARFLRLRTVVKALLEHDPMGAISIDFSASALHPSQETGRILWDEMLGPQCNLEDEEFCDYSLLLFSYMQWNFSSYVENVRVSGRTSRVQIGNRFEGPRNSEEVDEDDDNQDDKPQDLTLSTLTDHLILDHCRQQRNKFCQLGIGHRVFELSHKRMPVSRNLLSSGISSIAQEQHELAEVS
ncbi:hypothetical protein V8E51_006189 [Hyaloscypha variabilis]